LPWKPRRLWVTWAASFQMHVERDCPARKFEQVCRRHQSPCIHPLSL
jgi:hypothetical protein